MFFRYAGAFTKSRAYCIMYRVRRQAPARDHGTGGKIGRAKCATKPRNASTMPAVASRSGSRRWAVELGALAVEFERLYVKFDGTPIQPERLLRAQLLQAVYSVRSELQLMEQLDYDLPLRWFLALLLRFPRHALV